MNSFREDFINKTLLTQAGSRQNHAHGIYGYGELSYEIDTLNLLNFSFNRYGGDYQFELDQVVQMTNEAGMLYKYDRWTDDTQKYGTYSLGADYQRTFSVKDRLLTASYLLDIDPDDSRSDNLITNAINFHESHNKQYSNASTKEHTFQLDYTTPVADIHTIEIGAKYIRRINESNSQLSILSGNDWIPVPSDNDHFEHSQDILSAYAGYGLKYKKWGFKTGLRYEINWLNAEFPLNTQQNFDTHSANLIPSATITYMLKPGQTLKTGYNMRIQRPGIWYLNPYVNTTDTNYIRYGNPDLNAVKYHVLNMNYNFYTPKFNMNMDLSYNFTNNGIDELTKIENNVSKTSYFNIAKSKTVSLSAYLNWSPNPKLRLYANLGSNYMDVKANDASGLKNSGFAGNLYGGIQYTIPWDIRLGCVGYYSSPRITLQGESSGNYAWGVNANKSLLDKKLTLRLYVDNPLGQNLKLSSKQTTPQFHYESDNIQKMRRFGISVSYRFGEMKTQIKKAQRSIQNDDNMSGGNSGGSGGQQGGGL
ncbi:hypothetical protein FACS189428_5200 [Clostridia bacterium]|nr:hypothetical protein FACS189428_5200 [Clostridia bacterium]